MESNRPHQPAGLPPSMRRPAPNPARPPHRSTNHEAPPPPPQASPHGHKPSSKAKWIGLAVAVLVILALAVFVFKVWTGRYNEFAIKSGQYQAVFLANNMVYFGKLSKVDGDYVQLTDIYYLQVQNQGQQQQNQQGQQPQVSLAKLGGELHGPEDTMYIDRKQIIFWENLKTDSRVIQAIKDSKGKK